MTKIYTFVFFGIVGSGKGTQVKLLEKYLRESNLTDDIVSTSTGSEYRAIIESGSYTGQLVKDIIERGELQPNFLTISLFTNILISSLSEGSSFIADGFPRTIEQSKAFDNAMKFYNRDEVHIFNIELSKEKATERMKLRGRSDDTDAGIAKRFEVYEKDVIPSMNYFKDKEGYVLHTIDGDKSVTEVFADIIKSLNL